MSKKLDVNIPHGGSIEIIEKEDLSKNEERLLAIMQEYIREHGYPPAIRELAELSGYKSTSSVHGLLKSLEDKGYIVRAASTSRAVRIVKDC